MNGPFTRQMILDAIPHRPPFLFVDEILEWTDDKIVTAYRFKEDEFFFKGHYPQRPIVPGVLLCESAMQAGGIFLSHHFQEEDKKALEEAPAKGETLPDSPPTPKVPVVGRMNEIRFKKIITPGEEIQCEVTLRETMTHVYFMNATIRSGGKIAARFEFACTRAGE